MHHRRQRRAYDPEAGGIAFKPPRLLKPGDRMRLSVEGLGEQNQPLVAYQG